jgi:hypothetical protein
LPTQKWKREKKEERKRKKNIGEGLPIDIADGSELRPIVSPVMKTD